MSERIEVVYEHGVLRPTQPLPPAVKENSRYIVTIENPSPPASLDEVRRALAKVQGMLSSYVSADRDER
jgi:predicted DNA-binding antitoxin AbrB/MazE fold protein